jgi:hypothetical protein
MFKGMVVAFEVVVQGVRLGEVLFECLLPSHLVVLQLVQSSLVNAAIMPTLEPVADPS